MTLTGSIFRAWPLLVMKALKAAREIMAERVMRGKNPDHSRFEITDEAGNFILVVAFEDAYAADQSRCEH
jgi:hypothetical protein